MVELKNLVFISLWVGPDIREWEELVMSNMYRWFQLSDLDFQVDGVVNHWAK